MKTLRVLLSCAVVASTVFFFSTCDEPEKPKPEIISLTPDKAPVGEPVTITGKNLSTVETISFGNITNKPATVGETTLVTVVPEGSRPGATTVTVKSSGGTSNQLTFEVLHSVPEITAIEPVKAGPGMEVTLKGKYFETASVVSFSDKTVTALSSLTDVAVKVKVPEDLEAGATDVTITSLGGTSEKFGFTVVGKPTVTKLSPASGPVGKIVTITGAYFEEASKVLFDTGEAEFVVTNGTTIEATVPTTATTGKVKVITPGGEAISAADFIIKDGPELTTFTPASGVVNTEVTISGKNFDAGEVVVKFGDGKASTVKVVNATQIKAKVPAAATSGKITVETAAGSAISTNTFTVIGAPTVVSFSPGSGVVGSEITVNGTNFVSVSKVAFNGVAVAAGDFTVVSAKQLKAKVPAGASTGKISVTSPSGTGNSSSNFNVNGPPTITDFTPKTGNDGTEVTITGTNFTGTTKVEFNDVSTANFTVVSSTQVKAKAPAGVTTGRIKITTPLGLAVSAENFKIPPVITSISPVTGSVGTIITIEGTNLNYSNVTIGSKTVTPFTTDDNKVTAQVPSGVSGAVNVSVSTTGGTSNAKTFTVSAAPLIEEIVSVANIADQLILIKGSSLLNATKIFFGGVEAVVMTSTNRVVTAIIPASLSPGAYQVKVETPKGNTNELSFTLLSERNNDTGGVTLGSSGPISALPAGYVPPISNVWTSGIDSDQTVALGGSGTGSISAYFSSSSTSADGEGYCDLGKVSNILNNYVELTLMMPDNSNGGNPVPVRFVGLWTQPSPDKCYHHLTLISTESGRILELYTNSCN